MMTMALIGMFPAIISQATPPFGHTFPLAIRPRKGTCPAGRTARFFGSAASAGPVRVSVWSATNASVRT